MQWRLFEMQETLYEDQKVVVISLLQERVGEVLFILKYMNFAAPIRCGFCQITFTLCCYHQTA